MNKQIYFFIGTTAELIKLSAVLRRFKLIKIPFKIISSGQNEINFEELQPIIGRQKADIAFKTKSRESSYFKFVLWAIKTFFMALKDLKKELAGVNKKKTYFIVHGDTISALIGALVAKFYRLKLVHIEAGYRSFNFFEPFPEEITRVLISYLTDVHFCPDVWSLNNIKNHKGVKISTGENTLYETCLMASEINRKLPKKYFLLVLHRQEHMMYKKDITKKYIRTLISFAKPQLKCIFILHQLTENFLKEQKLLQEIKENPNIITIPRLPYKEFMKFLTGCEFIATDGGSNQQEAYYLGKPCLILRKYTEQTEGLESNTILASDNISRVHNFLANYKKRKRKIVHVKIAPSMIIADYILKN